MKLSYFYMNINLQKKINCVLEKAQFNNKTGKQDK